MAWVALGGMWGSGGAEGRKTSLLPVLRGASVGAEDEAGELGWTSPSSWSSRNSEGKLTEAWHGLAGPPLPLRVVVAASWSKTSQDDHELALPAALVPPSASAVQTPLPVSAASSSPSPPPTRNVMVSMLS